MKLIHILEQIVGKVKCKNKDCGWEWNLSDGGKNPYVCHKCGTDNSKPMSEMAETDDDFKTIMLKYKSGSEQEKSVISAALGLGFNAKENSVYRELRDAGKEDVEYIKKQLGVSDIEEESKGLWHNIRAKRARGEAPAKKGSKAFKQAVKAAKEINKNK